MATFSDSFNRVDNDVLGLSWLEAGTDTTRISILNNQLRMGLATVNGEIDIAYWNDSELLSQFSEATLSQWDAASEPRSSSNSPAVMLAAGAGTSVRGYFLRKDADNPIPGTTSTYSIIRIDLDNTQHILSSVVLSGLDARAWGVGKTVRLEIDSNILTHYVSGISVQSVVDTTYTSGFVGFFHSYDDMGWNHAALSYDNWFGGGLAGVNIRTRSFRLIQRRPTIARNYIDPY